MSLSDGSRKIIQRNAAMGRYAVLPGGDGYLLYANRGTLFAEPFNLERQETAGTAVPVAQEIQESPVIGAQFDISAD
jgi:hypothetical protein